MRTGPNRPARTVARSLVPLGVALLALVVPACSSSSNDGATTTGGSTGTSSSVAPGTTAGTTTAAGTAPDTGAASTSTASTEGPTSTRTGGVTTPTASRSTLTTAPLTTTPTVSATTTAPPAGTGTLEGWAYFGPNCNFQTHDGCPPVTDYVIVTGGTIANGQQVSTDANGHFSVQLPPGTYQWKPRWMAHYVCNEVPTVVVTAGATSSNKIWCNWQG